MASPAQDLFQIGESVDVLVREPDLRADLPASIAQFDPFTVILDSALEEPFEGKIRTGILVVVASRLKGNAVQGYIQSFGGILIALEQVKAHRSRRTDRVSVKLELDLSHIATDGREVRDYTGRLEAQEVDLSATGIKFAANQGLQVGDKVKLRLQLSPAETLQSVPAKVVRCAENEANPGSFDIACAFEHPDETTRYAVERFVFDLSSIR